MPEELAATEEVAEGEVSEELTGVDEAQPEVSEEEVDIGTVNLDDIDDPKLKQLAKQFQADYTRKTQDVATQRHELESERKVLGDYTSFVQQQLAAAQKPADAAGEINFDEANPQQIADWLKSYIETSVQGAMGPMQNQLAISTYSQEIKTLTDAEERFGDDEVRQSAYKIAMEGLTAETTLKAAAYDKLKADLEKAQGSKTKTKAAAARQTQVSATSVKTSGEPKKMSIAESVEEMKRQLESGEFTP